MTVIVDFHVTHSILFVVTDLGKGLECDAVLQN